QQSVRLLRERLRVVPAPPEKIAKLVAALDSERFADRQQAAQALEDLGASAEAALRKALEHNPALEVRQRITQLLDKRGEEAIRLLRAVEALEYTATPEAQQVLIALAKEAPDRRRSETAAAAVKRLADRHDI